MKKMDIDDFIADPSDLETKIKGTTLKCYYYMLLKNKPVGVREIQKSLGLSSPSVAAHHLNKLSEFGLIMKTPDNKYVITTHVKIGFLKFFVRIFDRYLPRYFLYTGFFLGLFLAYLIFSLFNYNRLFDRIITIIVLSISFLISALETYIILKESERFRE